MSLTTFSRECFESTNPHQQGRNEGRDQGRNEERDQGRDEGGDQGAKEGMKEGLREGMKGETKEGAPDSSAPYLSIAAGGYLSCLPVRRFRVGGGGGGMCYHYFTSQLPFVEKCLVNAVFIHPKVPSYQRQYIHGQPITTARG